MVVEINHDNHQVIKLDGLKNTNFNSKDEIKDISFDMDEIEDKSDDDNSNNTREFFSDTKSAKMGLKEVQSEPEEISLGRNKRESSGRIRRNSFHMYLEDLPQ